MPDLDFAVTAAEALPFAAGPTMLFKVAVSNPVEGERIQSVMLRTQIRIEVTRRRYHTGEQDRLLELFGEPKRWGETLRSMLWTNTTSIISGFEGTTVIEMPVTCTYDFDVASSKYFNALEEGEVPLLFLFSGTVFYSRDGGPLQIGQISWEREAGFRMPIQLWKDMMNQHFPNSAWIRLQKDVFDRLYTFKARNALPTWEAAIGRLLETSDAEVER